MAIRSIHRELDFDDLVNHIIADRGKSQPATTTISCYLRRHHFMDDMTGTPSDDIEKLKMAEVFQMIEELRPSLLNDYDRQWLKAILSPD